MKQIQLKILNKDISKVGKTKISEIHEKICNRTISLEELKEFEDNINGVYLLYLIRNNDINYNFKFESIERILEGVLFCADIAEIIDYLMINKRFYEINVIKSNAYDIFPRDTYMAGYLYGYIRAVLKYGKFNVDND